MITFTVTLTCRGCKAVVQYVNEVPPWVPLAAWPADELAVASEWCRDQTVKGPGDGKEAFDRCFAEKPAHVGWSWSSGWIVLWPSVELPYVICPACGDRAEVPEKVDNRPDG